MRIYITLYKNGKKVRRTSSPLKHRIVAISSLIDWDKIDLRVVYGRGFDNKGTYTTRADFRLALKAFTEK